MGSLIRLSPDSYHSTKCVGAGNGRKQSLITARLRRQVNKKRRRLDRIIIQKEQEKF